MVLPSQILPQHQTDPLVTLPLPSPLPPSPLPALSTLLQHFDTLLADPSGSKNVVPPMMIATAMRQINRDAHALLNAGRVGAAESRAELDRRDTVLRGVEYERNRIREEIERCLEYVPAYTGAELPDRQAFLESASEEVKSGLPNVGSEEYDYALIIAQLEEELKEIEEREVDVAALTKDRDSLIKAKKEIKLKFDLTETWLTDYARSTSVLLSRLKEPLKINAPALSALSLASVPATTTASTSVTEITVSSPTPAPAADSSVLPEPESSVLPEPEEAERMDTA